MNCSVAFKALNIGLCLGSCLNVAFIEECNNGRTDRARGVTQHPKGKDKEASKISFPCHL